jgi:mono/diheme cytochrome c family protein
MLVNSRIIRKARFGILFFIQLLLMQSALAEQSVGKAAYTKWCNGCHMDSPFAPGTIQLRSLRGNERALLENRKDLSAEYIRNIVRKGQNGMPLFRRTEISVDQLESLIEYLLAEK